MPLLVISESRILHFGDTVWGESITGRGVRILGTIPFI